MARFLRSHLLEVILVLGLLHGLLYIFLVPPWQHYDEPTHFEYAWLVANRPGLPKTGDYDQTMRRAVATSMLEHNFFRGMNFLPDLEVQNEPVWLGLSQLDDPPFYYLLASLPLRLLSTWDVTWQLYAVRFVSLGLYLLSIIAAWGMMKELVPEGHSLRWMVPGSMVLLPGFVDLMTAVNNDVGAVALFSLFLWGCVRTLQKGLSFPRLMWVVIAAVLCFWTKNTVILALPLLGIAVIFSIFRLRMRWLPWVLVAASILGLVLSVFTWGDASLWIRRYNSMQEIPTRVYLPQTPIGKHVIQLQVTPTQSSATIFQILPPEQIKSLQGKTVTLGGWIWASKSLISKSLVFFDGHTNNSQYMQITPFPTFFAFEVFMPNDSNQAQVLLTTADWNTTGETWSVFFDGVVLVEGSHPLEIPPRFDDSSAKQGTWGGQQFTNLLRNASGENVGLGIRPWVEKIRKTILPPVVPSPSLILGTFLDWQAGGWYYRATAFNMLSTFWAKFGWGHVPLTIPFVPLPYYLLAIGTFIGLLGAGLNLLHLVLNRPWNVFFFLGLALLGIWGQSVLRGVFPLYGRVFIPVARYAYPVIIPSLLVLNTGWLEIGIYLERWSRISSNAKFLVYFLLFLGLDIAALLSIIHYYTI